MNSKYNYIIVDNPNGPPKESASVPFAQLVDTPVNTRNIFEEGVAKVQVKDMYLPNYSLRISKGVFTHDALFLNTSANGLDLLGSCLFPEGKFTSYSSTDKNTVIESNKGTQNFKFDPLNEYQHKINANTPFHLIHFSVNPAHIFQFLPEDESWSDYLKNKIGRNEKVIGARSTPILLAQERAMQTILDCPLTGKMGELMIETSITQIILLQLHSIFQKQESEKPISKRDQDTVQSLKEYLSKNFLCDHSLDNLARHFATNTSKLMVLFKKTFGKSIFDYISELRMDYAHRLLKDDEKLIIEVARELGYKNPNHFSSAFKKKFGINPSQVR